MQVMGQPGVESSILSGGIARAAYTIMFTCRDGVAICRLRAFLHARPKIGFFFFQKGTFFL